MIKEIIISFEVYLYCTNATIYYIILTGVPVYSINFSHLVIQYTSLTLSTAVKIDNSNKG